MKDRAGVFAFGTLIVFASIGFAADPVRIGSRSSVEQVEIDVDGDTGHLFAILRGFGMGTDYLSVNISTDDGATWQESYYFSSMIVDYQDVDLAVVGDWLYVAVDYEGWFSTSAVYVVRFDVDDGSLDSTYGGAGSVEVLTTAGDLPEIELTSNTDTSDDRLYLFFLEDWVLRWLWTDADGGDGAEPWNEIVTLAPLAAGGLDAAHHPGSTRSPMVSFVGVHDLVYFWTYDGAPIHGSMPVGAANRLVSAVAARHDDIVIVYEDLPANSYLNGLQACESHDGGDSWSCDSLRGGGHGSPVATGRGGGGVAVAYQVTTVPKACELIASEYDPVAWSGAEVLSDPDLAIGTPMAVEWLPETDYGVAYISDDPDPGSALFYRPWLNFTDGFESGDTGAWSSVNP